MPRIAKTLLAAAAAILTAKEQNTLSGTPTAELLAWHNDHAERFGAKPVQKFKDRATAEDRCVTLARAVQDAANAPPRPRASTATNERLSESVRHSWGDPDVRAARAKRHAVVVAGDTYPSLAKAFEALNLDAKKVPTFRAKLVQDRKAKFGDFEFKLAA